VAEVPFALRLAGIRDHTANLLVMLSHVRDRAKEFDIIHFHIDQLHYPLFAELRHKCVTTLHGRLDLPDFHPIYRAFPQAPLVSISDSQRLPMPPGLNWVATVHHGMPPDTFRFNPRGGDYLAFLGRIAPEKRPDRAIEVAKRVGIPLRIAAKVDDMDRSYFEHMIKPLLNDPLIEFVGEISDREKGEFLGNALALLFPIDWPEPFGIVMIEAMAVGTPVIAWRGGSVSEVIDDDQSGILVESVEQMSAAVERVSALSRQVVRERFEARFTAGGMARKYLEVYGRLARASAHGRARLEARPMQVERNRVPRESGSGKVVSA
jgi:glycosyltransferase involved in cell wall biosynthesis